MQTTGKEMSSSNDSLVSASSPEAPSFNDTTSRSKSYVPVAPPHNDTQQNSNSNIIEANKLNSQLTHSHMSQDKEKLEQPKSEDPVTVGYANVSCVCL